MGDNHTPSFLRKQESSVLADPAKSRWVPAFAGTTSCLQLTLCQSLLLQTKFPPFLTAVPTWLALAAWPGYSENIGNPPPPSHISGWQSESQVR